MIVEIHGESTEDTARLVKALVDAGKLDRFRAMVEDAHPVWHAICMLEEDLLAYDRRHPDAGILDGWRIVVGSGKGIQAVPEYVGWGHAQAWVEHGMACCTIEPRYGVVCRGLVDFINHHHTIPWATTRFADDSGIHLNAAMREMRELEVSL